jgi:hypothetical protein
MKIGTSTIFCLSACLLTGVPGSWAQASTLLAGWNFNDGTLAGKLQPTAGEEQGSAAMTIDWANVGNTTGTTINLLPGDTAGQDINFFNGTTNTLTGLPENHGGWLQFEISMVGWEDLHFSYAGRTSSGGMRDLIWSWSIDGTTFTDFAFLDHVALFGAETWGLVNLDLSDITDLNNQAQVWLRGTITTQAGQPTPGSIHNTKFDNVQLNATAIPEPSTYAAIFGVLALVTVAARRRFV